MSETVTLELPDTIAGRVRAIAAQTHRPLEEVLIEWLARAAADVPVEDLPDTEVLALRDLQMSDTEQDELSALLARQREGALSDDQRGRLDALMRSYRHGMVRKAQALKVAVDRGLQPRSADAMTRRTIPAEIDRHVREAARNRCGYCLSPQHLVMARLEIEHIIPLAKGGTDDESNLWLACPICNGHKSDKTEAVDPETDVTVPLFNPRTQLWSDHFIVEQRRHPNHRHDPHWPGDGRRPAPER